MRAALLTAAQAHSRGLGARIRASAKKIKPSAFGGWNVDRKGSKQRGKRSR